MRRLAAAVLITVAMMLASCGSSYTYAVPSNLDDGWEVAELSDAGIDVSSMERVAEAIDAGDYGEIDGLLIVRGDRLVFEEYWPGYEYDFEGEGFRGDPVDFDAETLHNLGSVTKVFTATAVGQAIADGAIPGLDARVFDYFPEHREFAEGSKLGITVEHLLTMTSGLGWNQRDVPINDESNDLIQMFIATDPYGYVLAKPLVAEPGTSWYYSEGDANLLAGVIDAATGRSLDQYLATQLFEPLSIEQARWTFTPSGIVWASGNLEIRPRDLAKVGVLYLDGGEYHGRRVLDESWVSAATSCKVDVSDPTLASDWGSEYGFHWFCRTFDTETVAVDAYLRTGWGGQALVVIPEYDLVVVFTGSNYEGNYMSGISALLIEHILPAM
ncbi:serine hydrolase domain-containing protein [Actinomycetota bacterium]